MPSNQNKRKRKRQDIWFNPPFSGTLKTNVGSKFLHLVDKHFKGTVLEKYFNRKTVKVSLNWEIVEFSLTSLFISFSNTYTYWQFALGGLYEKKNTLFAFDKQLVGQNVFHISH